MATRPTSGNRDHKPIQLTDRLLVNFKCRSGAAALRSLSDGTCCFARADELNDALEAKFALASPASYARTMAQTLTELAAPRQEPARCAPEEEDVEHLLKLIQKEDEAFAANCPRVGIISGTKRPDSPSATKSRWHLSST
jgi:hypothetical protein